jgi:xanthine dehydrogenase YagR molybdenum-binding subunit
MTAATIRARAPRIMAKGGPMPNSSSSIRDDNLADYLVPVNADIRDLQVILVPERDTFVNPAGIKGLGELGNVGTAVAVANAVYNATGIRVRQLPIRLEKLMA